MCQRLVTSHEQSTIGTHSRLTWRREGDGCGSCCYGVLLANGRFGLRYPGILVGPRGQGSMCAKHVRCSPPPSLSQNFSALFAWSCRAVELLQIRARQSSCVVSCKTGQTTIKEWSRFPIGERQANALPIVGCIGIAPRQHDLRSHSVRKYNINRLCPKPYNNTLE